MPRPGTRRAARCRSACMVEVGGPQDAEGLRARARAQDPPLRQRSAGHLAHGPARPELVPRQHQGRSSEGFVLRHFGDILTTQLKHKFNNIVDKVQVTLYVDEADVKAKLEEARKAYLERDIRLASMTDESVDTFYSCILCQSFAPNHVCVVSPERLGLCGAYNWLDAKAAYEIDPNGANQPVLKGETIDRGEGPLEGRGRICVHELAPGARVLQRLQHHGRAHDLLRLLRVHRGHRARGQRRDDREPRLHRHDPHRHEVLDPGRHRGRRRADPGLHGHRTVLPHEQEVPLRRRRVQAHRLDDQEPEGVLCRAVQEARPRKRACPIFWTRSRTRPWRKIRTR